MKAFIHRIFHRNKHKKEYNTEKTFWKCSIDCDDRNIMVAYILFCHMFLGMYSIEKHATKTINIPV